MSGLKTRRATTSRRLIQPWLQSPQTSRTFCRNGGRVPRSRQGALVAKWSRAQDQFVRFTAIADLLQALHKQGVPVAPPLAWVDAQHRVIIHSGSSPLSMTVQPQIDGDLLDTTDETAVRQTGACLATLHSALAIHRDSRLIEVAPGRSLDLRQRIETWLELEDAGTAPTASARLRDQIVSLPQIDSEPQLIHNDYRASNILTAGSEILAVIDFDGVAWDYCINDLANAFVCGRHPLHQLAADTSKCSRHPSGGVPISAITHPARTPMAPSTRALARHQRHPSQ
jgi:Ser/Thr protein kinase RdoA (MazF antagonist)